MRLRRSLLAVVLVACVNTQAHPLQSASLTAEQARLQRLAGLARVWGAVKFFHPYPATRRIDWDKALIETIPRVNAATSASAYRAAIGQMLAVLNDKNTFVENEDGAKAEASINPSKPELIKASDGTVTVEALTIAETLATDQSAGQSAYAKLFPSVAQAKAVILDCRTKHAVKVEDADLVKFYFDDFLSRIVPQLTAQPIQLASSRYRMHNGYASQSGFGGDAGYYSSLITTAPRLIQAAGKKALPIVVIINDTTPSEGEMWSGLQAAKHALVVQEGEAGAEPGVGSYAIDLPDGVRAQMRTTELVNPDGSIGFQADVVVPKSATGDAAFDEALKNLRENRLSRSRNRMAAVESPQSAQDDAYEEMNFPSAEYRLLALFRFWNVINYFYPYKHLISESWETLLPRYIAKFEANQNALDYQTTVREMATEIHDSHAFVSGAAAVDEWLGMFVPPVLVRLIERQTVVVKMMDDKVGLRRGDVILTVDGEPVEKRRERFAQFFAASTPQALDNTTDLYLLRGQKEATAKLTVRDPQGQTRTVEITRTLSLREPAYYFASLRATPTVQVLPSGFGYVDLARIEVGAVNEMFEKIKDTPATIFDMRGYPRGTAWAIASRLTEKQTVVAALFSRRILEAVNLGNSDYAGGTNFTFEQYLPKPTGGVYKGKVVMLIDNSSISQAEHTCLFFEAATNVTFIGTPTKGANGDVTNMMLPGGIAINFSGHDVRHADGRQLQRIGIQPTIRVEPTLHGIISGQDEILEAAIRFLQSNRATR
ncbi:MAG: S41 family peptidase [Blastocatellia bacterium]